ncbi:crossover junction endodeoxyribonuclease RuvC [uncultured Rhodospira sp.]|uniref:crossover junction endodeoxyribonuclease RuvC n=1 Tax=uncultured Rhodospira sp. TaxID=1936189 RepID=UPI00260CA318|nr:crossover junction endodeoxyribonuclease RuvC [uncultured Rhodospira sp.]
MRILGLDPGLRVTGWGIVEAAGNHLSHVADGVVTSDEKDPLADRLAQLHDAIMAIIAQYHPAEAAVEETFVNRNPLSTLKLGQARGVVMLAPARCGLPVAEYTPNAVKKAVVGRGHAEKAQIALMVRMLLPGAAPERPDAADALAVAICHAHRRAGLAALAGVGAGEGGAPR